MPEKCFFLVFLALCILPLGESLFSSETTALTTFRSTISGKWIQKEATSTPCTWQGVHCQSNHITILYLPNLNLTGRIPSNTIGNLTRLQTFSLPFNSLTGQLPSDLVQCSDLRNLSLQGNQFSGEIPAFIFKLHNLVELNLAGNNFSGVISPAFNDLTRLCTLFLEKNQLSGTIPELNLSNLVQFNFSYNRLTGWIPLQLQSKNEDCFKGNSLCGGPAGPCLNNTIASNNTNSSNNTIAYNNNDSLGKSLCDGTVTGVVSIFGFVTLVVILAYFLLADKLFGKWKFGSNVNKLGMPTEKKEDGEENSEEESEVSRMKMVFCVRGGREFELEDLLRSLGDALGKGTVWEAYKAHLSNGEVVVVKRLNKDVRISEEEFRGMVEVLGLMDHENLVPLRAYYYSNDEKLLVYDYMTMGSLSEYLHGNRGGAGRCPLSWDTRLSIALGAARGIEYLHSQGPGISHGDIKSSNILLTKSCNAQVADFGLTRLNCSDARRGSQKSDVYCFGILLLELLKGKALAHSLFNEVGAEVPKLLNPVVVTEDSDYEVFDDLELLKYLKLLQLTNDCVDWNPDKRPTMPEVVQRIEDVFCDYGVSF